ncbi:hypothetical protein V1525DRAFT_389295 [Lipomyces kononenkoae]|uniref:Uncharacterized protein n=1 Tax=Lipomyces kononenkoae TaxID=34357 RepID=A0ACC3SYY2_LIPKO
MQLSKSARGEGPEQKDASYDLDEHFETHEDFIEVVSSFLERHDVADSPQFKNTELHTITRQQVYNIWLSITIGDGYRLIEGLQEPGVPLGFITPYFSDSLKYDRAKMTEIFIDSTFGTNKHGYKLYCVLTEYDLVSLPLSYLLLYTRSVREVGKRGTRLTAWLTVEMQAFVLSSYFLTLQPRDLPKVSAVRGCRLEPHACTKPRRKDLLRAVFFLKCMFVFFRTRQPVEGAGADVARMFNEYYDHYKVSVLLVQATGVIIGAANRPVENLRLKSREEIQAWVRGATTDLIAGRMGPVREVFSGVGNIVGNELLLQRALATLRGLPAAV